LCPSKKNHFFVEPWAVPALVPESYEGQTGPEVSSLSAQRSSRAFMAGKNKFEKEKSFEAFYRENVPVEPPPNHCNKPPLIISELGFATMGIFP
jgi:hypothetical protein